MKYMQILVSLFIVIFVVYKIGINSIQSTLLEVNPVYLIAVGILYFLQIIFNIIKFKKVAELFGQKLTLISCVKICVKSLFFGLVAFGGLGEFLTKTYQLKKNDIKLKDNLSVQVYDKILSLSGLVSVSAVCLIIGGERIIKDLKIETGISNIYALAFFILCVFLLFFIVRYSRFKNNVISISSKIFNSQTIFIYFLAVLSNSISIIITALCFKSLNVDVFEKLEILYSSPIISFVCAFPLFFNGWGVREILWKYLFTAIGLEANKAVVGSLMIGILLPIVVSIMFIGVISIKKFSNNTN